jgi:hypothetical protein
VRVAFTTGDDALLEGLTVLRDFIHRA